MGRAGSSPSRRGGQRPTWTCPVCSLEVASAWSNRHECKAGHRIPAQHPSRRSSSPAPKAKAKAKAKVDERVFKSGSSRCCEASKNSFSLSTLLCRWETVLVRWKKTCLYSVLALALLCLYFAAANVETDTSGMPNLFPKEHNQGHGTEVMDLFASHAEVLDPHYVFPPKVAEVCREHDFKSVNDPACVLFWCEADSKIAVSQGSECNCYRQDESPGCYTPNANVVHRFVGRNAISTEDLQGSLAASIERNGDLQVGDGPTSMQVSKMAPMVLEEWLSGDVKYEEVTQAGTAISLEISMEDLKTQLDMYGPLGKSMLVEYAPEDLEDGSEGEDDEKAEESTLARRLEDLSTGIGLGGTCYLVYVLRAIWSIS